MNSSRHLRKATRVLEPAFSLLALLALVAGTALSPTAVVQSAPAAQQLDAISLSEYEQSTFSPHLKASFGEELQYTIRYTITTGTAATGVQLQDDFSSAPSHYLQVRYVAGSSEGPVAMNGDTPPLSPVTPNVQPRTGNPLLTWALADIANSSGNTWVYEMRYRVTVYWDQDTTNTRVAQNTATMTWTGGSAAAPQITVSLVQPIEFNFNKVQDPPTSQELLPGDNVTWTLSMQVPGSQPYQGTAYDLLVTDTLPAGASYLSGSGTHCTPNHVGQYVYCSITSLGVGASDYMTIVASIPDTNNVAHDIVQNKGQLLRSSAPGANPDERVYRPAVERTTTAYIQNISIGKSQRSPVYSAVNDQYRAVAGEEITITIAFTVPQGIILYNPTLRVLLEDGMDYIFGSAPPLWGDPQVTTTQSATDPWRPGGQWEQLEWAALESITNTAGGPVIESVSFRVKAQQNYFVPGHTGEVPHNEELSIVPIVRWSDNPLEEPDDGNQYLRQRNESCGTGTCVRFIRPDLRYQSPTSGSYFTHFFPGGRFEGDTQIRFTLHLRNRNETPAHPTAYETVLTDTLAPGLVYVSASPAPAQVVPGPGGTVLLWTTIPPIDAHPDEELFVITATLPVTMPAGAAFTTTAQARYTTFSGSVAGEGNYLDSPYTAQYVVVGGYGVVKNADAPRANDELYIGDFVTYTVALTINPGIVMYQPQFDDIMPKGFIYMTGSMVVDGGTLVGSPWTTSYGDGRYELHWTLANVDNRGGMDVMAVQMTYRTIQTGRDALNAFTYAANRGDFVGRMEAKNTLNECWHLGSSSDTPVQCLRTPPALPADSVYVIQPWLADTGQAGLWNHTRTDLPKYDYEVGETVHYRLDFKNTGRAPAYDIVVTETLPVGLAVQESSIGSSDPNAELVIEPPAGATGLVTWVIDELGANQTVSLYYDTIILSSADACSMVTATINLDDYTSQPGGHVYDRHYGDFDGAFGQNPDPIPVPDPAPYINVLGVCLSKTDTPDPVAPGNALNYRIEFGNTSLLFGASNVRITDTYDVHTTCPTYVPSNTDVFFVSHNTSTRTWVWGMNNLPPNSGGAYRYIDLQCTVNLPFNQNDDTLTNYGAIDGQGDRIGKVERWEDTHVTIPFMLIEKAALQPSVMPGELLTYTLSIRNIGELTAHNVQVDEIYDPYVTFVEATPPPIGTGHWEFGSLGISQTVRITVTVRVDRPVPPDLTSVTNRATVSCDEVLATQSLPVTTGIIKPLLSLATTDSQDPVPLGGAFAYTMRYTNTAVVAHNVVLTVTMDQYVNYNTATPLPTNCSGNTCYWNRGTLNPGQSESVVLFVTVMTDIPPSVWRLTNRAYIGAYEVGPRQDLEYTWLEGRTPSISIFLPLVSKRYAP